MTSVAWVVTDAGADLRLRAAALKPLGFEVHGRAPSAVPTVPSDLRVLPADLFVDPRQLRLEYVVDPTPTLILVSTTKQELEALDFIRESDEVGNVDDSPEVLARKLTRLHGRGKSANRLATLERLDPLTGLVKRNVFEEVLARRAEEMAVEEATALLCLDLDRFKAINDRYGHGAGDQVLREVAWLLRINAAPDDCFARIGDDEFGVLLTRYDRQTVMHDAQQVVDRLLGHTFHPSGTAKSDAAKLTASGGLTFLLARGTPGDALGRAEIAIYEAKSRGRATLVVYETLREAVLSQDRDVYLQHFENVTRVVTERVTNLITQMGRGLVETARREANQDALTQLHNRRYFDSRITREVDIAHKHGRALTIALIDIDHFRQVNSTFGWPTGDEVLRRFAAIGAGSIRLVDWLARYGGEEFCLVMPDTDLEAAMQVAERIRGNVEAATMPSLDGRPLKLTVSLGVACLTPQVSSALELVQKASDALLEAKRSGRNRVVDRA